MKDKMSPKTLIEIITWLYENHREYDSGAEWRRGLIEFLMKKTDFNKNK